MFNGASVLLMGGTPLCPFSVFCFSLFPGSGGRGAIAPELRLTEDAPVRIIAAAAPAQRVRAKGYEGAGGKAPNGKKILTAKV